MHDIPSAYVCPITSELMLDPVQTITGDNYERKAIEEWLYSHDTNPLTNETLPSKALVPNRFLRQTIRDWVKKNPLCSVDEFNSALGWGLNQTFDCEKTIKCIRLGADVASTRICRGRQGVTMLHYLCTQEGSIPALEAILDHGVPIDSKDSNGETALFYGCKLSAPTENIAFLLSRNASFRIINMQGISCLLAAINGGNSNTVKLLLERGVELHIRDEASSTALHYAALHGMDDIVNELIFKGLDINAKNVHNWTPLHCASSTACVETVRAILSHQNCMVDMLTSSNSNALHLACSIGNEEIVQLLLDARIDYDVRNTDGQSALDLCEKDSVRKIVGNYIANEKTRDPNRYILRLERMLQEKDNLLAEKDKKIADLEKQLTAPSSPVLITAPISVNLSGSPTTMYPPLPRRNTAPPANNSPVRKELPVPAPRSDQKQTPVPPPRHSRALTHV